MVYAISDIHGRYDLYEKALQELALGDGDTLYILGDVIDRGPDGIRILEDILERENVILLKGNHEYECFNLLKQLCSCHGDMNEIPGLRESLRFWIEQNGVGPTVQAFVHLPAKQQLRLLGFVDRLPLKAELEVDGQRFLLTHTIPSPEEFEYLDTLDEQYRLWARPEIGERYREGTIIVIGHTPTECFDPACKGRILSANGVYDIDCGAVFTDTLGCLCLNDLRERYFRG